MALLVWRCLRDMQTIQKGGARGSARIRRVPDVLKAMQLSEQQMIEIFKALSDPNRLQIFNLLLQSDRTNSELMDITGLRQNLLSHHLNILTECGLVHIHRSIGDARRHYYGPRLDTMRACREWWMFHSPQDDAQLPPLQNPRRVLFLCRRNGIRSMLAEGLARHMAPQALQAFSAGIDQEREPLLDLGVQLLAEHSVPAFGFQVKSYESLLDKAPFDFVITVCDIVHESAVLDVFEGAEFIHWSLPDPIEEGRTPEEQRAIACEVFDMLKIRIAYFVQRLAAEETAQA